MKDLATTTVRILVTGSRDWSDRAAVHREIERYLRDRGVWDDATSTPTAPVVIVHGGARGADEIAKNWAVTNEEHDEAHPADWDHFGNLAGPLRNRAMVRLGADVCLAFANHCHREYCTRASKPHMSHGTDNCTRLSRRAGIEVRTTWGQ